MKIIDGDIEIEFTLEESLLIRKLILEGGLTLLHDAFTFFNEDGTFWQEMEIDDVSPEMYHSIREKFSRLHIFPDQDLNPQDTI